jgi:hypothetical protein
MDILQANYIKFEQFQSLFNNLDSNFCKKLNVPQFDLELNFDKKQRLTTDDLFLILNKYASVEFLNNIMFSFTFREQIFVHMFGWSIPSLESLEDAVSFIELDTVVEIAAGVGFWSALLRSKNVNVYTTSIVDNHYYNHKEMETNIWTPIEILSGVDAVQKYTDANCLFLSWGNGVLYQVLPLFKGNKIIIIGEDEGGCTDYLDCDDFYLVKCVDIPRWRGLNDIMRFYVRK